MDYRCVIALALCSILIGSMLGMRFRFVILLPVIAVGSAALAAISAAQGGTLAQAVLTIVVFASLLQFGYICAAVFKHAAMPAYANGREAARKPEASILTH
ncbi:MAG: hypothetical protein JWR80_3202 [Bradyrhizobium sp.]|nr:hypothetical protein [Bradyrhizobium sp.]